MNPQPNQKRIFHVRTLAGVIRRFIATLLWPFTANIGWWNRIQVLVGTACGSVFLTGSWRRDIAYWLIWFWVYQMTMVLVYRRGEIDGAMRLASDFRGFTEQHADEFREVIELEINRRLVAVEDLKRLCRKYQIPFEEVKPIIERGYGMQVVERPDDD